jgi:type II secretory pathway pseudopilin PulG
MNETRHRTSSQRGEQGIAMVALLVALTVMGVMLSVALPAWTTAARREKEAELVFRGEQYARAISLFQRKYGNASPPTVDILVTEHFLRKKWVDPITGGDFELLGAGSGIQGSATPSPLQGGRAGASTAQGRGATITSSFTGGGTGGGARGAQAQPQQQGGRASGGTTFSLSSSGSTISSSFGGGVGGATTGITGVRSKSKDKSLRLYNGADTYDQWLFLATQATTAVSSATGGQAPGGGRGGGQQPGARGNRGGQQPAGGRGQPAGQGGRGNAAPAGRGGGGARGAQGGGGGGGGRGF